MYSPIQEVQTWEKANRAAPFPVRLCRAKPREAEKSVERNTVPEEASKKVWGEVKDGGVNVKSEDTPETKAEAPAPGSIPTGTETFGSLKDGMLPSGATTDPQGKAKKPE